MYSYSLKLQPEWKDDSVSSLHIEITTDKPCRKGEDAFLRIRNIVNIPFCPFQKDPVLTDEKGVISCHEEDRPVMQSFIYPVVLVADRDSQGPVTLSYTVSPRIQPEGFRSSPYFDLVPEKGGVNGTGNTFLYVFPDLDRTVTFDLCWDLSLMPAGAKGIWNFSSSGTAHKEDFLMSNVLETVYMCGMVKAVESSPVGFYWFDTLPFDAEEGAGRIVKLFKAMAEMFRDKGGDYRVFARHNQFPGYGGTALTRSYLFGYEKNDTVSLDDLQDLLAHEMVHNWPTMDDSEAGRGTWYLEGSAEYYSTIVPFELGMRSAEKTAEVINRKAGCYWQNPMHTLSNAELGRLYWKDLRCQRVPYARGILFLSNIDAQIRRATEGNKTLLDVELKLLEKRMPEPSDFLEAVKFVSGLDVTDQYEHMCAGQDPVPDPDAFLGKFTVRKAKVRQQDFQNAVEKKDDGPLVDGYVWEVRK